MMIRLPFFALFLTLLLSSCTTPVSTPPATKTATAPAQATTEKSQSPTVKIALLLPLSGPSQQIGRSMYDAAQMALFDANMPGLTLVPINTETKETALIADTKQAIDQGAKIIIGPVFSKTTAIVANAVPRGNINILSFSTDKTLAGNGVFLMGFMLDQQIKRVADYAKSQGITEFYALFPANAYGNLALESLRNITVENDGSLIKSEFYSGKNNDLALSVKSIVEAINSSNNQSVKALFIPEGGENLVAITRLLSEQNLDKDKIRLIGSGQWDDPAVSQNTYLTGGWFAGSPPEQQRSFEEKFQQQYGYKPLRLASLAYDAVALSHAIVKQTTDITFSKEALTTPQGFMGVDGVFRLQENGITERRLTILQVGNGKFDVIDPAPQNFTVQ